MLGTNKILASEHCIAGVKVKQGYFKPPFWFFTILSSFITVVFRSTTLKYLHDSNAEYSDAAV